MIKSIKAMLLPNNKHQKKLMRDVQQKTGTGKSHDLIRFLKYVKPYWLLVALAAIGGAVKLTMPLLTPQVLAHFIDYTFNGITPSGEVMTQQQQLKDLLLWSLMVVGMYFVVWIPFTYYRHYLAGYVGERVVFDLRCELYQHIQKMSASYYSRHRSGEIVSRLINDITLAQNLVGQALANVWMDMIVLIVIFIWMLTINWKLTFVSISLFPLYVFFTKKLKRLVRQNSREVQHKIADMQGDLQEKITGYSVVKLFTREDDEQQRFLHQSKILMQKSVRSKQYSALNIMVVGLLTALMPILVLYVGGRYVIAGLLTGGQLVVFYSYLGQFYFPIGRISELNVLVSQSMAGVERIFNVLDTEADVRDNPDSIDFDQNSDCDIEFKNVTFKYDEGDEEVLKNFNLKIKAGQKVALVGHSGCGKTTVTNLITRFYDVNEGELLVSGRNIKEYRLKSLREAVGMVFQDTILFSGTLYENLKYGNPKAAKKDIKDAVDNANASEFISHMPEGLKTVVGERGIGLSGGQKQRIAIARVFLKNPKILILDEATSALDAESEGLIQQALDRLMRNRTSIVIAHRLSTIINSDVIVFMDRGKIVEKGTHDELLARNGEYAAMYYKQFKDVI